MYCSLINGAEMAIHMFPGRFGPLKPLMVLVPDTCGTPASAPTLPSASLRQEGAAGGATSEEG